MHRRQIRVAAKAERIANQLRTALAAATLWRYEDAEGRVFYLPAKLHTARSPYDGRSFPARPTRITPTALGKELKTLSAPPEETSSSSPAAPAQQRAEKPDLPTFAARVLQVAKSPQTANFYGERAFIASIYDNGFSDWNREEFDQMLIAANRARLVDLRRADLVGAMDPTLVRRSEVRYQNSTFHFVVIPGRGG